MPPRPRAARPSSTTSASYRLILLRLQCRFVPGGVPERPKGTGCKPVGSAFGGSNPPAPIFQLFLSQRFTCTGRVLEVPVAPTAQQEPCMARYRFKFLLGPFAGVVLTRCSPAARARQRRRTRARALACVRRQRPFRE